MISLRRRFAAEVLGTFILVLFGLGAVAAAVATGAFQGLFQVAAIWGLGLTLAIYTTGGISGAHLNPSITIAFALFRKTPWKDVPAYVGAQFLGAFVAAAMVFFLFGPALTKYETEKSIVRGESGSEATAMVFGEFYPPPGGLPVHETERARVPWAQAFAAELLGTALLAMVVFGYTEKRNTGGPGPLVPVAIGAALTVLICLFAPLSMAGFNPARDLAPRIFASLAGWGEVPFSFNGSGWFTVYVVAPILGAPLGGLVVRALWK